MGRAIDMEKDLENLKLRGSTMEKRLDILDDLEKLKKKEKKTLRSNKKKIKLI